MKTYLSSSVHCVTPYSIVQLNAKKQIGKLINQFAEMLMM